MKVLKVKSGEQEERYRNLCFYTVYNDILIDKITHISRREQEIKMRNNKTNEWEDVIDYEFYICIGEKRWEVTEKQYNEIKEYMYGDE